jgi:hypothetical protein
LNTGADHDRVTCSLEAVATALNGASGTVRGIDDDEFAEFVPVPAALTAATLNTYEVPLVRPVTVAEADVLVPSLKVVHEEPLFDEY